MRILFVNDLSLDAGWGAEINFARLIGGLERAGEQAEIFAGEVIHRGAGRLLDLWDPFARRELSRTAARFRPDVVHHNNIVRELSVSVLGVPRGTPTVLTVEDFRLFGTPDDAARPFHVVASKIKGALDTRVARRQVHVAIGISNQICDRLRAEGFHDVEHVPVCAPAPAADPEPPHRQTDVAFVARLSPDKGAHVAIEAFGRIAAAHPSSRLLIGGDGTDAERLKQLAAPLGDRVRFLGKLDEDGVRKVMSDARVFVAPVIPRRRPEGAGITVIEAALLGRPVVVSDDRAIREFVDQSGGGLVIPPESPESLAAALDRLLTDDELAGRLGDAGRVYALAHHTPDAQVPVMRAVYARAIERARRRAA